MNSKDEEVKIDERKTRELCGLEHRGLRCMRPKGHEHKHEALTPTGATRWE